MNNKTSRKILEVGNELVWFSYDLHNDDCEEQGLSDMMRLQENCLGCEMHVNAVKLMSQAETKR